MGFDKSRDGTPAAASSDMRGWQFTPECFRMHRPGAQVSQALAFASFSHQATGSAKRFYKPMLQFRRRWARAGTRPHCCHQISRWLHVAFTPPMGGHDAAERQSGTGEWHLIKHPARSYKVNPLVILNKHE